MEYPPKAPNKLERRHVVFYLLSWLLGILLLALTSRVLQSAGVFIFAFFCLALMFFWSGGVLAFVWVKRVKEALWNLTSDDITTQEQGALCLSARLGHKTEPAITCLRKFGADIHGKIDSVIPDRRLRESLLWRYRQWFVVISVVFNALALFCLFFCLVDRDSMLYLGSKLNALAHYEWIGGSMGAVPVISYMYATYRQSSAIWKLHASERKEKLEGARELAIWGFTEGALNEALEAANDPDTVAAKTARRAALVIRCWRRRRLQTLFWPKIK